MAVLLRGALCGCTGDRMTKGMNGLRGQPIAAAEPTRALGRV
jgi:hypothetical protein